MVEVASNDGYLLQYFVQRERTGAGHRAGGECGESRGRKGSADAGAVLRRATGGRVGRRRPCADLVLGNNVLAQVPDLNDFVEGLKTLLKPMGVLTLEFPHLLRLMDRNEFDTIYHEHFSYFSLLTTVRILEAHGLKAFDVEELTTHGGSLRVYACRAERPTHAVEPTVQKVIDGGRKRRAGLD